MNNTINVWYKIVRIELVVNKEINYKIVYAINGLNVWDLIQTVQDGQHRCNH